MGNNVQAQLPRCSTMFICILPSLFVIIINSKLVIVFQILILADNAYRCEKKSESSIVILLRLYCLWVMNKNPWQIIFLK